MLKILMKGTRSGLVSGVPTFYQLYQKSLFSHLNGRAAGVRGKGCRSLEEDPDPGRAKRKAEELGGGGVGARHPAEERSSRRRQG